MNCWSDWCEMKRKQINWIILGRLCHLALWLYPLPWPCIFHKQTPPHAFSPERGALQVKIRDPTRSEWNYSLWSNLGGKTIIQMLKMVGKNAAHTLHPIFSTKIRKRPSLGNREAVAVAGSNDLWSWGLANYSPDSTWSPSSPWMNTLRLRQFCRRYFQMHFHEWKILYFDKKFTEDCSQGSNW